jgi:hypothetical protein
MLQIKLESKGHIIEYRKRSVPDWLAPLAFVYEKRINHHLNDDRRWCQVVFEKELIAVTELEKLFNMQVGDI